MKETNWESNHKHLKVTGIVKARVTLIADNKSPGSLPILATLAEPLVSPSHWPCLSSDLFFSLT